MPPGVCATSSTVLVTGTWSDDKCGGPRTNVTERVYWILAVLPTESLVRSTEGPTVIGIAGPDGGAIVSVRAAGSTAWSLPWTENWPPSGTTFVIVGWVCAAAWRGRVTENISAQANSAAAADCLGRSKPRIGL